MFGGPLLLWVNLAVDTIYPNSNKFSSGVKIKATGELELNNSPDAPSKTRRSCKNYIVFIPVIFTGLLVSFFKAVMFISQS